MRRRRCIFNLRLNFTDRTLIGSGQTLKSWKKKESNLFPRITDQTKLRDRHRKLVGLQAKIEANLDRSKKDHEFFCENDPCPTCSQNLEKAFKSEKIKDAETKIDELNLGLKDIGVQIDSAITNINEADELYRKNERLKSEIVPERST
jgi:DNA repair exonuclease SbcCD ATPase subunit